MQLDYYDLLKELLPEGKLSRASTPRLFYYSKKDYIYGYSTLRIIINVYQDKISFWGDRFGQDTLRKFPMQEAYWSSPTLRDDISKIVDKA